MRRSNRGGNFFLCLIFNMLLNFEWSIPAWILLGLHFVFHISIWWFVGALALWIGAIAIGMLIMGWATALGNIPDPPKENSSGRHISSSGSSHGGGGGRF